MDHKTVRKKGPRIAPGAHPVEAHSYLIASDPVEEMANAIAQWLRFKFPGAMIYGSQRLGKTSAVKHFAAHRSTYLKSPVPVFHIPCKEHTVPTDNAFYQELLEGVGYGLVQSDADPARSLASTGTAMMKRRRLIEFLTIRVQQVKDHRVLLILDDAQWLTQAQYKWLMDLHNQLDVRDIRLVVVLVGQPELLDRRAYFRATRQTQIVGRFMSVAYEFRGVRSAGDLFQVLDWYDHHAEYPAGSGWSYTRYFVPKAFASGWRLGGIASDIWDTATRLVISSSSSRTLEVPMQALTISINFLLQLLAEADDGELQVTSSMIEQALEYTGFIDLAGLVDDLAKTE